MARVLVVDDQQSMREYLEELLRRGGHQPQLAASVPAALAILQSQGPGQGPGGEAQLPELVITDVMLGRQSGLDVLRAARQRSSIGVIVMTAYGTDEIKREALQLGAKFVNKPFKNDELMQLVTLSLEQRALSVDNQILRAELLGKSHGARVAKSPAMRAAYQLVDKVAPSRTTVLITGESGVGKELIARALHGQSPRASAPFVPVNCGAIPEGLIESELFGHLRGAFTGAQTERAGLFEAATGGTLFLDEIGELPLGLQVKLLRAIQERRVRPVGASEDVEVDVRLLAATNRDLASDVHAGKFREDLYYRLNVIQILVPPLRDRREDVQALADLFLARFAAERGHPLKLTAEARRRLDEYSFPGNVRELENLIERAVTLSEGNEVTLDALPTPLRFARLEGQASTVTLGSGFSLEQHLDGIEKALIDRALAQAAGVKKNAAALLGLTFRQFRHRVKKLADPSGEGGADPLVDDDESLGDG
jgi:two-component system response regulator PilR (NtrC family)